MYNETIPAMADLGQKLDNMDMQGPCKPDTVEELAALMREKVGLARDLNGAKVKIVELSKHCEAIKARLTEVENGIQKQAEMFDRETNWQ